VKRHRTILAAPRRSTSETWDTVARLIADTLERSSAIDRADVEASLARAAGIGRMLIAAGHLEDAPVVLIGGELYLEITTASGTDALEFDENLNPVPGGARATADWVLHLPQCEPLAKLVRQIAKEDEHLSAEAPRQVSEKAHEAGVLLDDAALGRWARVAS
jgi:hypothetical protein